MATAKARRSRHCMDIAAMIVGVAVGLVASAGMHGVRADNFGGPKDGPPAVCNTTNMLYSQCVGENWLHEVNYSSTLDPIWRTAFNSTGATYDAGSSVLLIMNDVYDPDNDARAANTNTANGYWGWTRCASGATTGSLAFPVPPWAHGLNWCKPQLIYINRYYEGIYDTAAKRLALACHELGHTMGLRHRDAAGSTGLSCMKSEPRAGSTWYSVPTGHEFGHLNYFYP